ncbi:hypothetical protein BC939DRAFT_181239 [Gamsiella multidivaricata]|uniref:uncharacterized protein n=1 Tax=Gamsiella multidivaricata TaxID=101098 RepID=UPI0022211883|nr:uncharacterized protein BC939DRAFT_181239 [Gamsiella multidivaricata]KAI7822602.1 hypothetical protein BC939DRAFT_181239 [Gamsiella multidivaricata]
MYNGPRRTHHTSAIVNRLLLFEFLLFSFQHPRPCFSVPLTPSTAASKHSSTRSSAGRCKVSGWYVGQLSGYAYTSGPHHGWSMSTNPAC